MLLRLRSAHLSLLLNNVTVGFIDSMQYSVPVLRRTVRMGSSTNKTPNFISVALAVGHDFHTDFSFASPQNVTLAGVLVLPCTAGYPLFVWDTVLHRLLALLR